MHRLGLPSRRGVLIVVLARRETACKEKAANETCTVTIKSKKFGRGSSLQSGA